MTLKELFANAGISQCKISQLLGITQPAVSKWLKKGSIPKRMRIDALANILNVEKVLILQTIYN